jgi:hypothetical protein
MPTRKQRRRREKQQRHEWEEVYVDEDGNELDPDEAEEIAGPAGRTKGEKAQARQAAGRRVVEPPSLRRTLRRGAIFFPLMVLTVFLLTGDDLTTVQKVGQAFFLLLIFLPFTHFMDVLLWRSYQRRQEKAGAAKKR